jgi:MarR family transcriptional regulator, organic hydroperoxide resistance regulator
MGYEATYIVTIAARRKDYAHSCENASNIPNRPKEVQVKSSRTVVPLKKSRSDAKSRADPLSPEFRLAHWPFFHMNLAIRSYDTEMKRLLRSEKLDVARWRILMVAHEHQPVSVGEVAEQTIMEPSTAMRAMQRLESDALITIVTRRSDQRVSEAQLTPKGSATTERVLKAASRVYRQAFASLDAAQIETLIGLLAEVHQALRDPI